MNSRKIFMRRTWFSPTRWVGSVRMTPSALPKIAPPPPPCLARKKSM